MILIYFFCSELKVVATKSVLCCCCCCVALPKRADKLCENRRLVAPASIFLATEMSNFLENKILNLQQKFMAENQQRDKNKHQEQQRPSTMGPPPTPASPATARPKQREFYFFYLFFCLNLSSVTIFKCFFILQVCIIVFIAKVSQALCSGYVDLYISIPVVSSPAISFICKYIYSIQFLLHKVIMKFFFYEFEKFALVLKRRIYFSL